MPSDFHNWHFIMVRRHVFIQTASAPCACCWPGKVSDYVVCRVLFRAEPKVIYECCETNIHNTQGLQLNTYSTIQLTHWGRVTHICVSRLTIIGSDNGLTPGRRRAIILTNAGILLIRTLGTLQWNLSPNSYIFIQENAFENVVWKMSAILSRPQYVNIAGS